ncbi:CopD family protein [Paenibacillus sp. SAFN-117]|uniref:CopD family protein n=1 Tax=Paenibacillus sp. SAFN-117 TaxID=3436860 RepID=UPI003F80CAA7
MSYRLSLKKKQLLITIHVISIISWFGGVFCMFMLGLYMLNSENGEQLYYTLENMHLVDVILIRYTALVALLSGLALSLWTNWGLFKYYWIVAKFILTIILILFGIAYLSPWLSQLLREADLGRSLALTNAAFLDKSYSLLGGAIANIIALTFMTAISYFKPFGKINPKLNKSKSLRERGV